MAKFEVEIGGNVAGLDKALKDALDKLGYFGTKVKDTTGPLNGLKGSSNQAGFALQNLGRVAQDAPFGFIGIQNNLNPLLESFQRLRAESGSNALALKALGSSLIGAGGLGLALSLVGGAILIYQNGIAGFNKKTKEAKDVTQSYISTLNELRATTLKGAQDAQKEVTALDTLFRATKNSTLSIKDQDLAKKQLQETALKTLGSLKDENGKVLTLEQTYQRLKSTLIQVAQVRAAEDKITSLATRQLENEQKIVDERVKNLKLQSNLQSKLNQATFAAGGTGQANENIALKLANQVAGAKEKVAASDLIIFNLTTDTNKAIQQQEKLVKNIDTIQAKIGVKPLIDLKAVKETVDKVKSVSDILKELSLDLLNIENDTRIAFGEDGKKKIDAIQTAIAALINNGVKPASAVILRLKDDIAKLGEGGEGAANIMAISKVLKDLSIDFQQIDNDTTLAFGEGFEKKAKVTQDAVNSLIEKGISPLSTVVLQLKEDLVKLSSEGLNADKINEVANIFKDLSTNLLKVDNDMRLAFGDVNKKKVDVLQKAIFDLIDKGVSPAGAEISKLKTEIANIMPPEALNNFLTNFAAPAQLALQSIFETFLSTGKLAFDDLKKFVLQNFIRTISDQLSTSLVESLGSVAGAKGGSKGGLLALLPGLLGKEKSVGAISGLGAGAGAISGIGASIGKSGLAAASGGILPAIGIAVAGISLLSGLFKKKQAPTPKAMQSSFPSGSGTSSGASFSGGGEVVFKIYGTELIGVLNRAGAKLATYQGP